MSGSCKVKMSSLGCQAGYSFPALTHRPGPRTMATTLRLLQYVDTSGLTPASRLALQIARVADAEGHDVMLLGLFHGPASPADGSAEATELGGAADDAGVAFRLILRRFRFDPGVTGQMDAVLRRFNPGIVQSLGVRAALLARRAWMRRIHWQAVVFEPAQDTALPDPRQSFDSPASKESGIVDRFVGHLARGSLRRADDTLLITPSCGRDSVDPKRLIEIVRNLARIEAS